MNPLPDLEANTNLSTDRRVLKVGSPACLSP